MTEKMLFINHNGINKEVLLKKAKVYSKRVDDKLKLLVDYELSHNGSDFMLQTEFGENVFFKSKVELVENINGFCPIDYSYCYNICGMTMFSKEIGLYNSGWVFENGLCVRKEHFLIDSVICDEKRNTAIYNGKLFSTKEECIAYNQIDVVKNDGTIETSGMSGYMKKLTTYTDEQKQVIDTIRECFKKCEELNVQFVIGYNSLSFINTKDFGSFKITDMDWGEEDCYELFDTNVETINSVYQNCADRPAICIY